MERGCPHSSNGLTEIHESQRRSIANRSPVSEAGFYADQTRLNNIRGFAGIDYSGGSVVAPLEDLLLFMKALVGHQLVSEETLAIMQRDSARLNPGFDYGYGIWQVRPVPLPYPLRA